MKKKRKRKKKKKNKKKKKKKHVGLDYVKAAGVCCFGGRVSCEMLLETLHTLQSTACSSHTFCGIAFTLPEILSWVAQHYCMIPCYPVTRIVCHCQMHGSHMRCLHENMNLLCLPPPSVMTKQNVHPSVMWMTHSCHFFVIDSETQVLIE